MKPLSWLFVLGLLCGCSQVGPAEVEHHGSAAAGQRGGEAGSPHAARGMVREFATLPDRGALTEYTATARRSGAYTWHAVRLSEAHAMRAIARGEMTVTAPDGTPIRLRYDRHVEHADGNWTWVGTTVQGEQAMITFGDTAAFGSIPHRGNVPLRLTTVRGAAWMVATDGSELAGVHNETTDPRQPDYLVPPKLSASFAPWAGIQPAAAAPAPAGSASSGIDLLVGYTQGFSAAVGGQAAAKTRIQHLVDVTNQAYVNSRVDTRVRLVHAMQVSYPDATDNNEALEELTGFAAPSTRTRPDPAFSALRSAREQYGADLVTLVRRFQTPENGGCGVAWLIGGGMSGFRQSDEFFGYSVVSDGQDRGADGTYYCRDETLAHELGHNMGAQHDESTAGNEPGVYSYSYGYKASPAAGDFYTVMAYGDSGQKAYRVFSNPRIDFCGSLACGNTRADVARSLDQTAPVVALFRDAIPDRGPGLATPRADFDSDGAADILWRNHATGRNTIWQSIDAARERGVVAVTNLDWSIVGTGDFNGDGEPGLLWRDRSTGRTAIWLSGHAGTQLAVARLEDRDWLIAGVGDFDGDSVDDLLWRHERTGANMIWRSGDAGSTIATARVSNLDWTVAGVADFNGDGRSDVLWRNLASGANIIWWSGDAYDDARVTPVGNFDWTVAALGDFDGDGRDDIFWRNGRTGANTIWPSGETRWEQPVSSLPARTWLLAGADDYDGDGRFDVLWRNPGTGENLLWRAADSEMPLSATPVANTEWQIEGSPVG